MAAAAAAEAEAEATAATATVTSFYEMLPLELWVYIAELGALGMTITLTNLGGPFVALRGIHRLWANVSYLRLADDRQDTYMTEIVPQLGPWTTRLEINRIRPVGGELLRGIRDSCPNLKVLALSQCHLEEGLIQEDDVPTWLEAMTLESVRLRSLRVSVDSGRIGWPLISQTHRARAFVRTRGRMEWLECCQCRITAN